MQSLCNISSYSAKDHNTGTTYVHRIEIIQLIPIIRGSNLSPQTWKPNPGPLWVWVLVLEDSIRTRMGLVLMQQVPGLINILFNTQVDWRGRYFNSIYST